MVPPFIEANTAQIIHALSAYSTLETIIALTSLSVFMFLLGFATNRSLAERPKLRVVRPGRIVTLPVASDTLETSRQKKRS